MTRRNLYIIITVIVTVILIGLLIFLIFTGGQSGVGSPSNPWHYSYGYDKLAYPDVPKDFKEPENILEDEVKTPIFSPDEKEIQYFSKVNNKFKSFDLNNNENIELINDTFTYDPLQLILWSPNKDQAYIGSYENGYSLIDFNYKSVTDMSGNIKAVGWSNDGFKIAYQYINVLRDQNNITISDPDGSDWQILKDLNLPDEAVYKSIKIGWFPGDYTVYYSYPSYLNPGREYIGINLNSKEEEIIELSPEGGYVNEIIFSPNGQKILASVQNEERPFYPEIWIMDIDGSNKRYTGIENEINKCAWMNDNQNIICALSANIQGIDSNDILVKVDSNDMGQTQLTGMGEETINVRDLIVSDDGTLYFVNNINENLYKLDID